MKSAFKILGFLAAGIFILASCNAAQTLHFHEGEPVNIVFVNNGSVDHEIVIEEFGFGFHVEPGETATAGFTPDKAGEFEIGCYIPGHYEAGMKGTLIVEESHGS